MDGWLDEWLMMMMMMMMMVMMMTIDYWWLMIDDWWDHQKKIIADGTFQHFFKNMLYAFIQISNHYDQILSKLCSLRNFPSIFFLLNLSPQIDAQKSTNIFFRSSTLVLGVLVDSYFFDASQWGLGGSPYASKSSWYPSFWFGSFGKSGHGRRQLRGSLAATAPTANAHVPCVFFSLVAIIRGARFFFGWFLEVSKVKWL